MRTKYKPKTLIYMLYAMMLDGCQVGGELQKGEDGYYTTGHIYTAQELVDILIEVVNDAD